VKNIVQLAIDAAEAAVVLGARALCAVAAIGESTTRNVHVDNLYAGARPVPPPLYYREHFADWDATKSTTEASPEADAGQPLASVVSSLTDDDYESAAFACRMYATMQRFDSATEHWFDLALRLDAQK
jgi:hypothetical protein